MNTLVKPNRRGLVLLKFALPTPQPFYIVAKTTIYDHMLNHGEPPYYTGEERHSLDYLFNEHSCLCNIFYDISETFYGTETDPHGLFEFVMLVEMPGDWGDNGRPESGWGSFQDWCDLFPPLAEQGQVIDGDGVEEAPKFIRLSGMLTPLAINLNEN